MSRFFRQWYEEMTHDPESLPVEKRQEFAKWEEEMRINEQMEAHVFNLIEKLDHLANPEAGSKIE